MSDLTLSQQLPSNLTICKTNGVDLLYYCGVGITDRAKVSTNMRKECERTSNQLESLRAECAFFIENVNHLKMDLQEPMLKHIMLPNTQNIHRSTISNLGLFAHEIAQCLIQMDVHKAKLDELNK